MKKKKNTKTIVKKYVTNSTIEDFIISRKENRIRNYNCILNYI
tara:strand:- start:322 stop:450 length:129 start_codon:yes stop_codon:yes gene_type:complete